MGTLQVQKVNWWHERLADWMLAHPDRDIKDAAPEFGCAVGTLYIVKNSDAFKQYWSERSKELSTGIVTTLKDKLLAVTELSLDALQAQIEAKGALTPADTLIDVANMGLKNLGYSADRTSPPPTVNVNISADILAEARARMTNTFGSKLQTPLDRQAPLIEEVALDG